MSKKNCNILITGATGFIGIPLAQRFKLEGYRVTALVRKSAQGPWDDCLLWNELHAAENKYNCIVHLAGLAHSSGHTSQMYYESNVQTTQDIIQFVQARGDCRLIFLSTVLAARHIPNLINDESQNGWPHSVYGASKREAEKLIESSNLDYAILRPALVYGKNVKGNLRYLAKMIRRGLMPTPPLVRKYRSMVSLPDVIDAIFLCVLSTNKIQKTYILTDNEQYTLRAIYDYIRRAYGFNKAFLTYPLAFFWCIAKICDTLKYLFGEKVPFSTEKMNKMFGESLYSSEKFQRELGWQPAYNFYQLCEECIMDFEK